MSTFDLSSPGNGSSVEQFHQRPVIVDMISAMALILLQL
jgi:hypothetical protein